MTWWTSVHAAGSGASGEAAATVAGGEGFALAWGGEAAGAAVVADAAEVVEADLEEFALAAQAGGGGLGQQVAVAGADGGAGPGEVRGGGLEQHGDREAAVLGQGAGAQ
jgi:hypothetical protein